MTPNQTLAKYVNIGAITLSAFALIAVLAQLLPIQSFRHDSLYYLPSYYPKLFAEGRWLVFLAWLAGLAKVPGQIWVAVILLCFAGFFAITSYRWTRDWRYAALFTLLVLQIGPIYDLILWPATGAPVFIVLFLAAILAPYINIWIFYLGFGVLFFGTYANYHFLLPLVHLPLLIAADGRQLWTLTIFRILPAWAAGFVVGYLVSVFAVFVVFGEIGIQIQSWRDPQPIENFSDLQFNVARATGFLWEALHTLLWSPLLLVIFGVAFLLGTQAERQSLFVAVVLISISIMTVHFIVTIPHGILISYRTFVSAWVATMVIAYFRSGKLHGIDALLLPILMCISTILLSYKTHSSLKWYRTVMKEFETELVSTLGMPRPGDAVAFIATDEEVGQMISHLEASLTLSRGDFEELSNSYRWPPAAWSVGYSSVLLCDRPSDAQHPACRGALTIIAEQDDLTCGQGLYCLIGIFEGVPAVHLNQARLAD